MQGNCQWPKGARSPSHLLRSKRLALAQFPHPAPIRRSYEQGDACVCRPPMPGATHTQGCDAKLRALSRRPVTTGSIQPGASQRWCQGCRRVEADSSLLHHRLEFADRIRPAGRLCDADRVLRIVLPPTRATINFVDVGYCEGWCDRKTKKNLIDSASPIQKNIEPQPPRPAPPPQRGERPDAAGTRLPALTCVR